MQKSQNSRNWNWTGNRPEGVPVPRAAAMRIMKVCGLLRRVLKPLNSPAKQTTTLRHRAPWLARPIGSDSDRESARTTHRGQPQTALMPRYSVDCGYVRQSCSNGSSRHQDAAVRKQGGLRRLEIAPCQAALRCICKAKADLANGP